MENRKTGIKNEHDSPPTKPTRKKKTIHEKQTNVTMHYYETKKVLLFNIVKK